MSMPKFLAALLALVLLLSAIVVLAPNLIPAQTYKGRIETAASNALGRSVTIGDRISFKIIPRTAFSVTDLIVANAPGFDGDHLAKVGKADIGVKLWPLISGDVVIDHFILTDADINLQKSAAGRVNWSLGEAGGETPNPESPSPAIQDAAAGRVQDIRFGDVQLKGGRVLYADGGGQTYLGENIGATVRLNSLSEPLEIDGTMTFQGAPSAINLVLSNLADLLAKKPANLKLTLTLGDAVAGADLSLTGGDELTYAGPISLDAPDLPTLASLFGIGLEDAPGFDRLKISGTAQGAAKSLGLQSAKINFDAIDAEGDLKLDWSAAKAKATGSLAAAALDFRPYMPPATQSADGFPAWSDEKIDFTSLRNINADLEIRADKVFLNEIEADDSRMRLTINNGRMTADISQLGFYGGGGSGRLIVDGAGAAPSISGNFTFNAVEAQPFSTALMKTDKLLGLGGFNLQFSASGASQAAIMSSLDGKGGFDLNDGAIKGVNIVKLASAVAKLYEGGLTNPAAISAAIAEARRADEQTDFSKMLSQFTIADGLVNAPTISLEGPYLTMTGAGNINLPGQSIDLRLLPRASTTMDNSSGRMVAIPLRVSGTFSKPAIAVDLEPLLRGKAESTIRNMLDNALTPKDDKTGKGDKPANPGKELLKGVLDGGKEPSPATEPSDQSSSKNEPAAAIASEALNKLFGAQPAKAPAVSEDENAEATPQPE